ncbi:hypothetical protein DM75_3211 [Burkholderia mallei]|nr:hypothetical protein DM75_3211 [Burkholderia mallei]
MRAIRRIPGPNTCLLILAPFRCDETTFTAAFPYTDRSARYLSKINHPITHRNLLYTAQIARWPARRRNRIRDARRPHAPCHTARGRCVICSRPRRAFAFMRRCAASKQCSVFRSLA